jgi:hypothetical protein
MDRARIELEWLNFESDSPVLFAEHIAAIARNKALEEAANIVMHGLIAPNPSAFEMAKAIRALKETK